MNDESVKVKFGACGFLSKFLCEFCSSIQQKIMMEMVNTYGQIQLSVRADNETTISVHVVKAAYLKSSLPFANATVAAGLIPVTDGCRRNPQTSTVVCSNNPSFNEILTVDIGRRTGRSRLFVAVWCKQSDRKSMELIGAMSFSLKQCLTQPFSGWYYLLEEHLGMSKSLQCGSPSDPPTGRRLQSEEMLYQNTTETHYKQPRRFPLSSLQPHNLPDRPGVHGTETYSRCRVRKLRASKEPPSDSQPSSRDRPSSRTRSPHTQLSSRAPAMDNRRSYRAPAPDSRPPPVPGVSQCWTTQGDVYTESERIYHTAGHYGTYTTSVDNTGSLDRRYKQPSQSLYKLPARRDVGSEEHLYMNMQELARFDQPVSVTGSHDSSCSSSRSSLLDDLRSVQSSTRSSTIGSARESVRSGSVRSGSIRGSSVRSMYAYKGDALYKKTSEGLIKVGESSH
ncbi:RGS3 [Bugula neritina]|uniref:RGS3 n=1 Tax=Bugula neritina TaxID=10212 RepID=A0A7J7JB03_BUGNE|nr:RGS3 [Bugula neritina]